ncbi:MAG: alpha/beta fold hydrolase, partial [Flavobacteriaceae bacterium]
MSQILHSKILGEGPPLIILHGFLGMLDNWKTLGNQYAKAGFQVHLVDQRNHGKSFWSWEFDYDVLAEDLLQYVNHHHLPAISLMGHSMGGKTAMQFACDHSGRVTKLIVADIAPKFYPPHHHDILDALGRLDFNSIHSRGEADSVLAHSISHQGIRQFLLKNLYWKEKDRLALRINLEVLSQKMEAIGASIGATAIFEKPTLFLRGDRSEYIQEADEDEIKRHFP